MGSEHAVVMGAGISGSLIAVALSKAGWKVTLIEAQTPGAGSSSRSAACIRQQFSTQATVRAMRYCVSFYAGFAQQMEQPGTPPVVIQNGYLFLHDDADRVQRAKTHVQIQHQAGLEEVVFLPREEISERFPWVDNRTLLGGTFCPTDGFLRPDLVYLGALEYLREHGHQIILHSPVQAGRIERGRLVAVQTPSDVIEGSLFINATNAWAPSLSKALGATDVPIEALKRYLYFLRRGSSMDGQTLQSMPMTIVPSRAYARPENTEQLLLGWAHHAHHDPAFGHDSQDFIEPSFLHSQGLDNYGVRLWMELAKLLPALSDFRGLDATTAGYYAATPDHNPIIDRDPNVPNLIHAVGFSGHGAMMGPFTAAAVSTLALHPDARTVELPTGTVPLAPFAFERSFDAQEAMVI